MKVSVEKQGVNEVMLDLELESERAQKAYEVACRSLSNQVNIPGFRKGKAPRKVIEKTLGVEYIKHEALDKLLPELLNQVIIEQKLDIIAEPKLDSFKFELGEPLELKVKVEVRPEVKLGKYKGLKITVNEAAIPEGSLDRGLASIAESKASLKEVANRQAVMGDTVVLDFECYVDGKLVEGGKTEGLILEMKDGNFLEGFCNQLVGVEPGVTKEVEAKFPEEYRNSALSGKNAKFKCVIKGIRERFIPELNDELAKSIGLQSLDDLKQNLQARMDDEIKFENEARAQKAIVDAVIANCQVEIPESMIERETQMLMNSLSRLVAENGQSFEEFQKQPEYEEISKAKANEAKQRVMTSLVLGAIVKAENLEVTEEEMATHLLEMSQRYNVSLEQIYSQENARRQVMEEILTHKVVGFLLNEAEITRQKDENQASAKKESTLAVS